MTTLDSIKNRLIDRILVARNEELLTAIENIFNSTQNEEQLALNSVQIEMLMMSEKDIENDDLISEDDLNTSDSKWMD